VKCLIQKNMFQVEVMNIFDKKPEVEGGALDQF
jgi:hypothetical protein